MLIPVSNVRQWLLAIGCAVLVLAMSGCSSSKSRVGGMLNLDSDLKLTIMADHDANPDHGDKPSPVVLRFYELSSPDAFSKADFIDLYERDEALLGNALVRKRVFQPLVPGEVREENLVVKQGATHVALYAEFSQYEGASYKVVFPITQNNVFKDAITVRISGNQLSLL